MKTKNGIELNLKESKFISLVENLKFYFSSELYKNKFENERIIFNDMETIKLKNKYKVNLSLGSYFDIALYKRIEKRGFYITNINTGKEIKENIKFKVILDE